MTDEPEKDTDRAERISSSRRSRRGQDRTTRTTKSTNGPKEEKEAQEANAEQRSGESADSAAVKEQPKPNKQKEPKEEKEQSEPIEAQNVTDRPNHSYYYRQELDLKIRQKIGPTLLEFEDEYGIDLSSQKHLNRHLRPLLLLVGAETLAEMSSGEIYEKFESDDVLDDVSYFV